MQINESPEQRMPTRGEEELNYFLGFVMVMAGEGHGEGTSKRGQGRDSSNAGDAAPDRSGVSRNLDEKKGTKRKRTTGDDPPGEDGGEPPPNRIHVEGDNLTFEEYLAKRHFVFIHHYSGEHDRLSEEMKKACEELGINVNCTSVDRDLGDDLTKREPFVHHLTSARQNRVGWIPRRVSLQHLYGIAVENSPRNAEAFEIEDLAQRFSRPKRSTT